MKVWEPAKKFESFFVGGKLCVSKDLSRGYSLVNSSVVVFETLSTKIISRIGTEILNFSLFDEEVLVTYSENDMLTFHSEKEVTWKSGCTVLVMECDKRGLLVTGSSDNSVRVYQVAQGYLTHKFKHKQPVTAVALHETQLWVVSASLDNTVKVWDLAKYNCLKNLNVAETVRGIKLSDSCIFAFASAGVKSWQFNNWKERSFEGDVSAMELNSHVIIGDREGNLIKLSPTTLKAKKTTKISNFPIISIFKVSNNLFVCNEESTVYMTSSKFEVLKEYIGHIDEVLDLKWLNASEIVVALNSSELKVLNIESQETRSLKGHTDNILCVDILENFIVTASKDLSIRYWENFECLATYKGHTEDITSVGLSKKSWFVSSSIDQTLKIWKKSAGEINSAQYTCVAHSKDISVVRISIDNKMIASGSQDKMIKLWTNKLKPVKELSGHKRGVWDICFNKHEKILCSSSGDMTVKLWNLIDFECIRTLEGSTNSILKAIFVGNFIVSAGSDGILKVWDYKTGVCHTSLDEHTGKIWGLSERIDENSFLLTGGTDSLIILWKDVTAEIDAKALEEKKETIKLEQSLQMELKNGHYVDAALIAFKLKRPQSIFNIIQNMSSNDLTNFVDGLVESAEGVVALLTHIRDWNCYKKYSAMAQMLLFEVFERIPKDQFPEATEIFQGILAYSNKHYARAEKLYMDSFLVEHLLNEISLLPVKTHSEAELVIKKQKIDTN